MNEIEVFYHFSANLEGTTLSDLSLPTGESGIGGAAAWHLLVGSALLQQQNLRNNDCSYSTCIETSPIVLYPAPHQNSRILKMLYNFIDCSLIHEPIRLMILHNLFDLTRGFGLITWHANLLPCGKPSLVGAAGKLVMHFSSAQYRILMSTKLYCSDELTVQSLMKDLTER
jgi:hypothetical protein